MSELVIVERQIGFFAPSGEQVGSAVVHRNVSVISHQISVLAFAGREFRVADVVDYVGKSALLTLRIEPERVVVPDRAAAERELYRLAGDKWKLVEAALAPSREEAAS